MILQQGRIQDQVWRQVEDHVGDRAWQEVQDQVWNQVGVQLDSRVGSQVWRQVWNQVHEKVYADLERVA